jgi:tRNA (cytidine/uridine-2'-O-)-methyltransferase
MKIVLVSPQIPQNTGNIVRTCSVTGCSLMLVQPLGFSVNDRWLKRAGLDYWEGVDVAIVDELESLLEQSEHNFYFFSSKAEKIYTEASFVATDWLIFGSETEGLPQHFHDKWPDRFLRIPMLPEARCLNLATSAGIVTYEALRQQQWAAKIALP